MQNKEEMKLQEAEAVEIDLKRLFQALLNRIWIIIVVAVLCGVLALVGTRLFVDPKYEATALFYVNNTTTMEDIGGISSGDIYTAKSLVDSYIVIMESRATLDEVIEYADLDITYHSLQSMISAAAVNETEIFRVSVKCTDPAMSVKIVEALAYVVPQRIATIIEGSSAKVVDYTDQVPTTACSPSYPKATIWGILLGLALSVGAVVLVEIMDVTVKDEEDLKAICPYPVLAQVPDMNGIGKKGYYYRRRAYKHYSNYGDKVSQQEVMESKKIIGVNIGFAAAEAYKLLRTKLQYSFTDDQKCRVIAVSSAFAGEGKSISGVNLVSSLAQLGKRVLILDCDMRRPTLAEKLSLLKYPGLSEYLTGSIDMDAVVQTSDLSGEATPFYVITAGTNPPNPIELLNSEKMRLMLEQLRQSYDYIVLDLPPVGDVSDALVASKITDGVLLVVRQDYATRPAVKEAVQQFEFVHAKVLGILMTSTSDFGGGYKRKYGYRYRYGDGYGYRHGYRYGRGYGSYGRYGRYLAKGDPKKKADAAKNNETTK